jgi:hypothetical protein
MDGLLDDLGITDRHRADQPPWLCLVDLPDNDSVEVDHRHQVEALLPLVDVVIWVTDPEKYRDASLHRAHIAPLAEYRPQFLFVLNQADRMAPDDLVAVTEDLTKALSEDGIDRPDVLVVAARPEAGPPMGVELLLDRLERERGTRETVQRKLLIDLSGAASRLAGGFPNGKPDGFEAGWSTAVDRAVGAARDGAIADGGRSLAAFIDDLADELGGETAARFHDLSVEVPSLFLGCVVEATMVEPEPAARSRPWRRRDQADSTNRGRIDGAALHAGVERGIGDQVRGVMARRGRAKAAVAELTVAVADLERKAYR